METRIANEIKQDPVLGPVVDRADTILRELFGGVRHAPIATWQPSTVKQAVPVPSVELELSDHEDYIGRDFRIDQLTDERAFRHELIDLWGDLIMQAYGKSNERLLDALRELRKEEERRELQAQGT